MTEIWQLWVSKEDADRLIKMHPGKVEVLSHRMSVDDHGRTMDMMFVSLPRNSLLTLGGVPRENVKVVNVPTPADIPCAQQHMDILEAQARTMQEIAHQQNQEAVRKSQQPPQPPTPHIKGTEWVVEDKTGQTSLRVSLASSGTASNKVVDSLGNVVQPPPSPFPGDKYLRKVWSKDKKTWVMADVYCVADAWEVRSAALSHALKKILMPGQRGGKGVKEDLIEAKVSIERAIEQLG